jgi:hypothetical protein
MGWLVRLAHHSQIQGPAERASVTPNRGCSNSTPAEGLPLQPEASINDLSTSELALLEIFDFSSADLSEDSEVARWELQAMHLIHSLRLTPSHDDDATKSGIPVVVADEWNLKFEEQGISMIDFSSDWGYIKGDCVLALVALIEDGVLDLAVDNEQFDEVVVEDEDEEKQAEDPDQSDNLWTHQQLQEFCTKWVKLFSAGHDGGELGVPLVHLGYSPKHVTPYVHCVARHCCEFIKEHGNLWKCSCQSLERRNAAHTRQLLQNGLMRGVWTKRMIERDLRLLINKWVPRGNFECPNDCAHPPFTYETCYKKHVEQCKESC